MGPISINYRLQIVWQVLIVEKMHFSKYFTIFTASPIKFQKTEFLGEMILVIFNNILSNASFPQPWPKSECLQVRVTQTKFFLPFEQSG